MTDNERYTSAGSERSEKVRRIMAGLPRGLVIWGWVILGLVAAGLIAAFLVVEWPYSEGESIASHVLGIIVE